MDIVLTKAPSRAGDARGLAKYYKTAVGLQNELTLNLDLEDGLVNGAAGIMRKKDFCSLTHLPTIIWIEFENEIVGKKLRSPE